MKKKNETKKDEDMQWITKKKSFSFKDVYNINSINYYSPETTKEDWINSKYWSVKENCVIRSLECA